MTAPHPANLQCEAHTTRGHQCKNAASFVAESGRLVASENGTCYLCKTHAPLYQSNSYWRSVKPLIRPAG